jgi:prepilin-type N-terminal cleavage/methylation domain-containing protein
MSARMMRGHRDGFTLIELLVGMTVAAIALAAGFAALASVHDSSARAEASDIAATAAATQRDLLMDWIAGARIVAVTGEPFDGQEDEQQGVPRDALLMPTTAHTPLEGPTTVMGLYIDDDPETPEYGLVAEMTGIRLGEEPRRMQLVPEAHGMNIRYLPAAGGDWIDGWQEQSSLPRAVEITLTAARGDTLPPLLRFPIRVAIGAVR